MMTNPNARTRLIHGVTCLLAIVATLTWVGCVETLPAPSDGDPVDNANDNDNVSDNANANANDNVSDNANDNDSGDQDGDVTYADPDNHHIVVFDQVLMKSYDGTEDCLTCHRDQAETLLESGHWLWEGESAMLEGAETETHGKRDLINNFCIAIPSNEGRCTQCHAGYGWSDDTFDFTDQEAADCLVCHDTTATYDKAPTTAGLPVEGLDLDYVAKQVGKPTRESCGNCHYNAGGGDNVKHGDLPSTLAETTRDHDVHMGVDGLNFRCQACHTTKNHQIAGMPIHSQDEGRVACTDCHDEDDLHSDLPVLNAHLDAVACQSCHIPAIARTVPTKVYWDWSTAGQDIDPIPTDDYGKALYDKKKGTFEWGMDVKPELHWFNGKWQRVVIGNTPHFERTDEPVVLADPVGDINDSTAKLYPFKKMTGKTPADPVNRIMLVPHLFGTGPGENPFWGAYDWALALAEGAAYAGQDYSGTYEFVDTVMYLTVNHEIPPASEALGCTDCHSGGIDFVALGYEGDPWEDTGR